VTEARKTAHQESGIDFESIFHRFAFSFLELLPDKNEINRILKRSRKSAVK